VVAGSNGEPWMEVSGSDGEPSSTGGSERPSLGGDGGRCGGAWAYQLTAATAGSALQDLDVAGLRALLALDHLELDLGTLLDRGSAEIVDVDEDILSALVWSDEAETLGRVEELDGTVFHLFPLADE
jgi:hypothetical protein